jgi:hypothetical protein
MQIVFFPWLFLKEPITLGPFTFENFRDKYGRITPSFAGLEAPLTIILQGYVDMRGRPFGTCVVVTHADARSPMT